MCPNRMDFLIEFDNFYQALVRNLKENKYNEAEFYPIMAAKVKSMDRTRKGGNVSLNERSD